MRSLGYTLGVNGLWSGSSVPAPPPPPDPDPDPETSTIATSVSVGESDSQGDIPVGIMGLTQTVTAYWVVVADGAAAPSAAQVIAGLDSAGATAVASGSFAASPGGSYIANVDETLLGDYDLHVVFVDGSGTQSDVFSDLDVTFVEPSEPTLTNLFDAPDDWLIDQGVTMSGGVLDFPAGLNNFADALQKALNLTPVTGGGTARITITPSAVVDGTRFWVKTRTYTGTTGDAEITRFDTNIDGAIVAGAPIVIDEAIPAGRDGLRLTITMVSGGGVATFDNCTVEMI